MNLFLESDSPPTQNPKACLVPLRASKGGTQKKQRRARELYQLRHPSKTWCWCLKTKECNSTVITSDGQNLHQMQSCLIAPQRLSPGHDYHKASLPGVAPASCELRATTEQTSITLCLPLPGMHPWYRAETDKPVLQAMVGEAGSLELPPSQ